MRQVCGFAGSASLPPSPRLRRASRARVTFETKDEIWLSWGQADRFNSPRQFIHILHPWIIQLRKFWTITNQNPIRPPRGWVCIVGYVVKKGGQRKNFRSPTIFSAHLHEKVGVLARRFYYSLFTLISSG